MAYKGKYFVKNKAKYRGDSSNVTYRSSWEKFIMELLDNNNDVRWWSSETTIIPYMSTADGKKRRYFMDFTIQWNSGDLMLWEVKPAKETHPPVPPANMTGKSKTRFMHDAYTWQVNYDKWQTTAKLCEDKGWKFKIVTEHTLKKMGMKGLI